MMSRVKRVGREWCGELGLGDGNVVWWRGIEGAMGRKEGGSCVFGCREGFSGSINTIQY